MVLDKLDYCATLSNLQCLKDRPNFRFVKGDIQCADLLLHILEAEQIDTVMHFAGARPAAAAALLPPCQRLGKGMLAVPPCTQQAPRAQAGALAQGFARTGQPPHTPATVPLAAAQTHVDNSFGNSLAFTMNNT